ncbi:glycosyltransferase family 2 protein [Burkholderia sp. LMU1-1-1.1]|uniref:glycosyltransferase family 2 protein n=1 Tax=Burkholderia sp. LMU1-1-1.1 TaxID=3135266 RepID=UPI0034427AC4
MKKLVVCVIVKNEARYLPEWLEYHLLLGVEHFYVYDNESDDNIHDALSDYDTLVTLIHWPGRLRQQLLAYQHFFHHHAHDAQWAAVIDADEFIRYQGPATLSSFLSEQAPDIGGLEFPWITFGTNGHKRRPSGLVIENYTMAHAVAPQQNCKSLCRPLAVDGGAIKSPHRLAYRPGWSAAACHQAVLALHHYTLRSYDDVVEKVRRGDAWSTETQAERWADQETAVAALMKKYDGGSVVEKALLPFGSEIHARFDARVKARSRR